MVAAISTVIQDPSKSSSPQQQHSQNPRNSRPPLLSSAQQNTPSRKPRTRDVASRYMSLPNSSTSTTTSTSTSTSTTTTTTTTNSSTSTSSSSSGRRYASPVTVNYVRNIDNNNNHSRSLSTPKRRSQSVEKRSRTPKMGTVVNGGGEISAANKLLVTSTRSLSVSFQGESFSFPISKTKTVNSGGSNCNCGVANGNGNGNGNVSAGRKGTPEKRRGVTPVRGKGGDQGEMNVVMSGKRGGGGDQQRWPGRARELDMLSRSLDYRESSEGDKEEEDEEYDGSSVVGRVLEGSLIGECGERRVSFDGMLDGGGGGDVLSGIRGVMDENSVMIESSVPSELTASDTDSVSSGSTSGAQEMSGGGIHGRSGGRSIMVSAKFWQETNMRLRRLQDPGLGLSSSPISKVIGAPKLSQSRKFSDGPMSSPRAMSSPVRGAVRAASPSKLMNTPVSSPMRGISPSRVRSTVGSSLGSSPWDTPSVLSFAVDVRRGKVGENRIVDAHQLRLLYNRHLQWRFVNARADAALSVQRRNAEKNLWNAWITITALRDAVRHKRTQLQLLRQKLKLSSILRGQMVYLEEWSLLDDDHSNSLQGAIEALKASTLRLPVVGGATADIQSVKEAVSSAVDVMQSMASSTCSLLTRVEEVNSLVAELSKIASKERILLEKSKEVLSMLAAMQVKDCSLRTHTLQLNRSQLA